VSAFTGMYLSYFLDTSASATIILTGTLMFIVVYAVTGIRGRTRISGLHHI
jgi:ABC-type Mn2+/Zn2+ transport system permease subunit